MVQFVAFLSKESFSQKELSFDLDLSKDQHLLKDITKPASQNGNILRFSSNLSFLWYPDTCTFLDSSKSSKPRKMLEG